MIPVAQPSFSEEEKQLLNEAIDTGWISSRGKFIDQLEEEFAAAYGAKEGVSVSNGTTALHLALVAAGIGSGDEVIVPDFTFISSANVIIHAGATPVFVDVERDTWNIDPADFEAKITSKTKAVIPVHIYGHPANMDEVMRIARANKIFVIEDAAEAQGAKIGDKFVGTIGDIGCFSFFGNKIMTTGEGGMCITSSTELAEKMRLYRSHGMDPHKRYRHPVVGYNYRMTNMQAAVGLGQLHHVDSFIAERQKMKDQFDGELKELFESGEIEAMPHASWAAPVCWFYCITARDTSKRDGLMKHLENNEIDSRPFFFPIHLQESYKEYSHLSFPISEDLAARGINLPTFIGLEPGDITKITTAIKSFFKS